MILFRLFECAHLVLREYRTKEIRLIFCVYMLEHHKSSSKTALIIKEILKLDEFLEKITYGMSISAR